MRVTAGRASYVEDGKSIGTGCPESYWSLLLWRYLKSFQILLPSEVHNLLCQGDWEVSRGPFHPL